jgi:uncharacterized protein with HEPN domain
MKGKLGDNIRLEHILNAINEVETYLMRCSYAEFLSNSEKRFATIKQIETIGEAANALTPGLKDKHPEVSWKPIKSFRNISIHEYFGVNLQLVWEIAKNDLPVLKTQISQILASLGEQH